MDSKAINSMKFDDAIGAFSNRKGMKEVAKGVKKKKPSTRGKGVALRKRD